MRIIKEHALGLFIDMQERLFPHMHKHEEITKNNQILIQGLKTLEIPLLLTQQYTKGLGDTIEQIKSAIGEFEHIEKIAFSCCDEPQFNSQLELMNRKFIIIAGIEAHVCVLQTVLDLIEKKYVPVVIANCISSRNEFDKHIAIGRMQSEGAIITTYESILFEMTRFSGTDVFKAISKLVK